MYTRTLVAFAIFFAAFSVHMVRVNFPLKVIYLIKEHEYTIKNDELCASKPEQDHDENHQPDWMKNSSETHTIGSLGVYDSVQEAELMTSYYFGFAIAHFLAAEVIKILGPTNMTGFCSLLGGIFTIMTPYCHSIHYLALMGARFAIGFVTGFVFESFYILILYWSPTHERSTFMDTLYGGHFGTFVTNFLCGLTHMWPWHSYLYFTGSVAVLFSLFWFTVVADKPSLHQFISNQEMEYILNNQERLIQQGEVFGTAHLNSLTMLKMPQIYILFLLYFSSFWNFYFFLEYLPPYFVHSMEVHIISVSLLLSISMFLRVMIGIMFDKMIPYYVGIYGTEVVTIARKIATVFSHIFPGFLLLTQVFTKCDVINNLLVILLAVAFSGAVIGGAMKSACDIMPHYAAHTSHILMSIANISGIIMPLVVVKINKSYDYKLAGWVDVMIMNGCIYLIGGLIYLIFGSNKLLPIDVNVSGDEYVPPILTED